MSDLKKKKRIRAAHRTYTRKIVEATEGKLESAEPSSDDLNSNKRILEQKLELIWKLDNDIMELMGEDQSADLEKEIDETSEFDRQVSDVVRCVEMLFKEHAETAEPQAGSLGGSKAVIRAKLPKLEIKKYSRDPKQWQLFWDSFNSAVYANYSLQNVDKCNYLRGLLEGAALAAITGLALTESNYEAAIEVLKERFGNKQLIISSHMESLLQLSPVTSIAEIKKIRMIYDHVEANVKGLDALGIAPGTYGSLLVPVMMNKLPEELRLIITRHFKGGEWNLTELLETPKGEIEARERCSFVSKPTRGVQDALGIAPGTYGSLLVPVMMNKLPEELRLIITRHFKGGEWNLTELLETPKGEIEARERCSFVSHPTRGVQEPKRGKGVPTAATLVSSASGQGRSIPTCTYCGGSHASTNCLVVADVAARKNVLRKKGRCFVCLKGNHISRNCHSGLKCFKCGWRHHQSICENRQGGNEGQPSAGASSANPRHSDQPQPHVDPTTSNQMSTLYIDTRTAVLLQTAQALASATDDPVPSAKVRVILDSCSQRSYV